MPPGLCLIDLDGTLRAGRTITHLAQRFHVEDEVARVLDAGLGPHASRIESERVMACFAGVKADNFAAACADLPCRPGARRLVAGLHERGFKVGIVTASYAPAAHAAQAGTDADLVAALVPIVEDGHLTGALQPTEWDGPCRRMVCKETVLRQWRDHYGASFTLAVGNADNDLCMFDAADMSVAVHPSTDLAAATAHVVVTDLLDILPLVDAGPPTDDVAPVKDDTAEPTRN